MPGYVETLAGDVVNGNIANAHYQGQSLGNLAAGDPASKLTELVDKWFLGMDHPAAVDFSSEYRVHLYQTVVFRLVVQRRASIHRRNARRTWRLLFRLRSGIDCQEHSVPPSRTCSSTTATTLGPFVSTNNGYAGLRDSRPHAAGRLNGAT